jgi:AGZA family xanthine/uracil permease-like MFS transporter
VVPPGFHLPQPILLIEFLRHSGGWKYVSIILPMSILDTMVSLQILESVKVAGDDYKTMPSLLVNGVATLVAAAFGSPFPTTLYFGHLAHKAYGARAGYSGLSGATVLLLCTSGLISPILRLVPLEVVAIVIVWFGLVMVAQAFQEVPKSHCIAVAFGLIPMLASWTLQLIDTTLQRAGSSFLQVAPRFGDELSIYGLIALSQGSVLVSMLWAAALAYMLDRKISAGRRLAVAGSAAVLLWIHSCLQRHCTRHREQAGMVRRARIHGELHHGGSVPDRVLFLFLAIQSVPRERGVKAEALAPRDLGA